jgi:hypothetical protein
MKKRKDGSLSYCALSALLVLSPTTADDKLIAATRSGKVGLSPGPSLTISLATPPCTSFTVTQIGCGCDLGKLICIS